MRSVIKREIRVAFSQKGQPTWFRISKWIVMIGVIVALRSTPYGWYWLGGVLLVGLALHLLWRWKTRVWTQPWGGWDDVEAGKP